MSRFCQSARTASTSWSARAVRALSSHRNQSVSVPQLTTAQINGLLAHHAAHPPRPLNLSTLLSFGRPPTTESVLQSVSYVLSEIPRRLATRVRSLEALPFIVGTNPYVANTLHAYRESFKRVVTYPPVRNVEENAEFAACLEVLVQNHANDIPTMAKGFQECSRYMTPTQISDFLDGAIRSRISVRLIAEQHIALSQAIQSPYPPTNNVGVVDMYCSPAKTIKSCGFFVSELCNATLGDSPTIVVDGHADTTFAYVPVHLEYILTEILKNSFRATVERCHELGGSPGSDLPPVVITISRPHIADSADPSKTFLSMRIRDQGGGVSPRNIARIFSYAFTTAGSGFESDEDDDSHAVPLSRRNTNTYGVVDTFGEMTGKGIRSGIGTIAGLGYGLPMSRLYAKYFGGSLDLISMNSWGSDVFLKLRCLDEAGDAKI